MKRVFIVGCPRSGTTLLQSIIADQSRFVSFPESHVFTSSVMGLHLRMFGRKSGSRAILSFFCGRLLNIFGLTPPETQTRICNLLKDLDLEDKQNLFNKFPNFLKRDLSNFIDILDSHAGSEGWVEKAPNNLFCIDVIEKYVPNPLFIHILRDGESTIASIVDAAQRYNDWNRRYLQGPNSIERLVTLWNQATTISLKHAEKQNHLLVRHENLINNPSQEIQRITSFLDIAYSDDMLDIDASPYILPYESWKQQMGNTIKPQKSKFTDVLSEKDQNFIKQNLISF